jgi:hypothetical protein
MHLRTKKDPKADDTPPEPSSVPDSPSSTAPASRTPRPAQKIPLPHNSLFILGPETNKRWLHSIHRDNRPFRLKTPEEQDEGGERISLTFRYIGTFLIPIPVSPGPAGSDSDSRAEREYLIYGQGATSKDRVDAQRATISSARNDQVLNEGQRLVIAFGKENHESEFDWDKEYGEGFDVLHFSVPPAVTES